MTNKIIFWDMDKTLGAFGQIAREMQNRTDVDDLPPFGLRQGIEELLEELSDKGYKQYIVSSATSDYGLLALERTGLSKYFEKKYFSDAVDGGYYRSKQYGKVLRDLGMDAVSAGKNILIIGDNDYDVPDHINTVVTILDSMHFMREASLTKMMINMLEEHGRGSFNKGFQELYHSSNKMPKEYDFLTPIGKIILDNDTILHLKFMESRKNYSGAPIFEVYRADNYFSKNIKENDMGEKKK
jgi:hypothetical protein